MNNYDMLKLYAGLVEKENTVATMKGLETCQS